METLEAICESVEKRSPHADLDLLRRCYAYAEESHRGQFRRSGDPYLVHPMGVAKIIADLNLDVPSICAGILHDCVEDTSATSEDIRDKFGEEIQKIVDGVTKLGQIPWTTARHGPRHPRDPGQARGSRAQHAHFAVRVA